MESIAQIPESSQSQKGPQHRQTFADYLRKTKPEKRRWTKRQGDAGLAQTETKSETEQEEKDRREDHTHADQRVHAVKTLLDLQSKQLSKLAACHNRAIQTEANQRLAREKMWKELLQPTEAILMDFQRELTLIR
ncbi:hypothetical protein AYL99_11962 [Fonsecaea erecta]|uniref:Uncharacterized protein n=1 Tax=Fonsecaea erecta TaxID=1367422 RepID=A0A178Z215_9EURO|nr:hypothetical protein AYL99_11962 [Fonsecaea erecta]OAP53839.1 hypothetical protein AYL99_11962 [Fonsecaea erecta]